MDPNVKHSIDALGVLAIGWAWVSHIPWTQVAAFMAVLWYALQGYYLVKEKWTARRYQNSRKEDRRK